MSGFDEWNDENEWDMNSFFYAERAYNAGQQSQQAKIDELQKQVITQGQNFNDLAQKLKDAEYFNQKLQGQINSLEKHLAIVLDQYYMEDRFSTKICNEAEKALNKDDRLNDSWYVKYVKPYSE